MTNGLHFPIDEKQGFPVKIGEVELWFDDSFENLSNFFDVAKKVREEENEIEEQLKKYQDVDETTMDTKTAKEIMELKKKSVAGFYNGAFGKGSFEKVYEKYPYINQLESLIIPISESINETFGKREQEKAESIKSEYLKKKTKKK